jgi:hypothetical protein
MTQILNLTLLAPDIQEDLLCLPRINEGKAAIHEKMLRPVTSEKSWQEQRTIWSKLRAEHGV